MSYLPVRATALASLTGAGATFYFQKLELNSSAIKPLAIAVAAVAIGQLACNAVAVGIKEVSEDPGCTTRVWFHAIISGCLTIAAHQFFKLDEKEALATWALTTTVFIIRTCY